MNRREFLQHLIVVSAFGVVAGAGAFGILNKLVALSSKTTATQITTQPSTTQTDPTNSTNQSTTKTISSSTNIVPNGYVFVTQMSALAGMTQAYFNHPKYGSSILFNYNGSWHAFSAICTHAGCNVSFDGSSIFCPCHSGYFSPSNGAVTGGPPPSPLSQYGVKIINNNLYVSEIVVN